MDPMSWRLPSGKALAEFALQSGFLAPLMLGGPRIKPGTRLIRLWQDKTHTVEVLQDGFEWEGRRYSSLSAIAKAISGTNWNGYTFFGVKRRPLKNKNGTGPRRQSNG